MCLNIWHGMIYLNYLKCFCFILLATVTNRPWSILVTHFNIRSFKHSWFVFLLKSCLLVSLWYLGTAVLGVVVSLRCRRVRLRYRALRKEVGGWVGGFEGFSGSSPEWRQVIEVGSVEKRQSQMKASVWTWVVVVVGWGSGRSEKERFMMFA